MVMQSLIVVHYSTKRRITLSMTCHYTQHVRALSLVLMQAPPMLSANATRSKSLAPLPVSTAASSGECLEHPVLTLRSFREFTPSSSSIM